MSKVTPNVITKDIFTIIFLFQLNLLFVVRWLLIVNVNLMDVPSVPLMSNTQCNVIVMYSDRVLQQFSTKTVFKVYDLQIRN